MIQECSWFRWGYAYLVKIDRVLPYNRGSSGLLLFVRRKLLCADLFAGLLRGSTWCRIPESSFASSYCKHFLLRQHLFSSSELLFQTGPNEHVFQAIADGDIPSQSITCKKHSKSCLMHTSCFRSSTKLKSELYFAKTLNLFKLWLWMNWNSLAYVISDSFFNLLFNCYFAFLLVISKLKTFSKYIGERIPQLPPQSSCTSQEPRRCRLEHALGPVTFRNNWSKRICLIEMKSNSYSELTRNSPLGPLRRLSRGRWLNKC